MIRRGLPATRPSGSDDTESMLRTATWTARTIGLAVVGLVTFLHPPTAYGALATQIVAYALICVGVAGWGLADLAQILSAPPESTSKSPESAPRRSAPLARFLLPAVLGLICLAASVGAAMGGASDSMIAYAFVAAMAAAELLPPRTMLAIATLGGLSIEIGGIASHQSVGSLLGYPLLLVVAVLVGRNRASYRIQAEQAAALLRQHEQLRAEQRRADVLDERARIAREIHDVLAHSLGALGIQIQAARALLTDRGDVERALETLSTAQRMASDGLAETRRAVHALRTDTLPLHEEIARAAAEHTERHAVAARCETMGTPRAVPPDATVALLRTAREALVNAAKHAPGREIGLRLDYQDHAVRLTVANDLNGGAPGPADAPALRTIDGGYGLTGMRERLRLLRGGLDAGPRGKQWVVTADLPLDPSPESQRAER
jgi:signal transduction histidine kinase